MLAGKANYSKLGIWEKSRGQWGATFPIVAPFVIVMGPRALSHQMVGWGNQGPRDLCGFSELLVGKAVNHVLMAHM